ncbi:hypothetical protein BGW41_002642 [Actinomortierella wolfii]|nr:hypothetical protein BGW41_002642 [Actinomortierella wolfii]
MRLEASSSVPEPQERITGEAHFPCKIFTQTGVIPVSMSLTLVGEGTILTKLSVELWEAVYRLDDQGDADGNRKPLDMRLCSRQNCPLSADWRPSTLDAPSFISKRLLFKVPDMPVSTWSKNKDGYTAIPGRGVCHTSGEYLCSKIKIEHTFKLILEYQYEVVVEESAPKNGRRSNTGGSNHPDEVVVIRDGVVEAEERVMIVSHLDSTNGHDAEPPCYYRSFTSVPVNPSHIPYIDAAIAHALHDDPHAYPHDEYGHSTSEAIGSRLPDYEECIESVTDSSGGSSRVNSIRSVSSASMRDATSFNSSTSSLGQFGAAPETDVGQGTASPPQSPSSESHQLLDLTSYIERYSRGELPV